MTSDAQLAGPERMASKACPFRHRSAGACRYSARSARPDAADAAGGPAEIGGAPRTARGSLSVANVGADRTMPRASIGRGATTACGADWGAGAGATCTTAIGSTAIGTTTAIAGVDMGAGRTMPHDSSRARRAASSRSSTPASIAPGSPNAVRKVSTAASNDREASCRFGGDDQVLQPAPHTNILVPSSSISRRFSP
jgi:hypothetical protein